MSQAENYTTENKKLSGDERKMAWEAVTILNKDPDFKKGIDSYNFIKDNYKKYTSGLISLRQEFLCTICD